MKKYIFISILLISWNWIQAHDINNLNKQPILKEFQIDGNRIVGTFLLLKDEYVFIENTDHLVQKIKLNSLSQADQEYVIKKQNWIKDLNEKRPLNDVENTVFINPKFLFVFLFLLLFGALGFKLIGQGKQKFFVPIFILGLGFSLFSFTNRMMKSLSKRQLPSTLDSAFAPFKPQVHTFYDNEYFYVESKGIPITHEMMVGISNQGWQQQVPIPQCYLANNAWPIPLNPVFASNPIPVDSIHFTRGAIAIAANGVPIFNVHTNTGVDSYLDGQLDNYGGHCGRADDYHYHIAPLHLYNYTSYSLPIAYGLDGFPVFGSKEPDGSNMLSLDINHGHHFNGSYHYHGTTSAPYMIARMAGQVTEDNTHQLIPQAAAKPVRPSLTPLKWALISSCTPNGTNNGFRLSYLKNGNTDSVVYNWTSTGVYTFKYYHNGSLDSTRNFNGFVPCSVPISTGMNELLKIENQIIVYPQPNPGKFQIKLEGVQEEKRISEIQIFNLKGELIYQSELYQSEIDLKNINKGIYILQMNIGGNKMSKKIIIQ
ncbi:MAG: T9SS type A sorting domain-containing protein [Bacteroidia bacterium]